MNKLLLTVFMLLLLNGCDNSPINTKDTSGFGFIRVHINNICLDKAAKINKATTQNYNDLSEVVSECSTQSWYQANSFCERGCTKEDAKIIIRSLKGED